MVVMVVTNLLCSFFKLTQSLNRQKLKICDIQSTARHNLYFKLANILLKHYLDIC